MHGNEDVRRDDSFERGRNYSGIKEEASRFTWILGKGSSLLDHVLQQGSRWLFKIVSRLLHTGGGAGCRVICPVNRGPRATLNSAEGPIIIISAAKKSLDRGVAVGEFLVSDLHTRQKEKVRATANILCLA